MRCPEDRSFQYRARRSRGGLRRGSGPLREKPRCGRFPSRARRAGQGRAVCRAAVQESRSSAVPVAGNLRSSLNPRGLEGQEGRSRPKSSHLTHDDPPAPGPGSPSTCFRTCNAKRSFRQKRRRGLRHEAEPVGHGGYCRAPPGGRRGSRDGGVRGHRSQWQGPGPRPRPAKHETRDLGKSIGRDACDRSSPACGAGSAIAGCRVGRRVSDAGQLCITRSGCTPVWPRRSSGGCIRHHRGDRQRGHQPLERMETSVNASSAGESKIRTYDDGLSAFMSLRPRIFAIAYRILESAAEAEDVVQDVWVRWQKADRSSVRDAAAFLTTTTTRLAINVLHSARSRRERYAEAWLPEAVDTSAGPELGAERGEALQAGILLLLERLSPTERAAYILREAFEYSYRDIANVLRLEEANARQVVTRARQHVAMSSTRSYGRRQPAFSAAQPRPRNVRRETTLCLVSLDDHDPRRRSAGGKHELGHHLTPG